MVGWGAGGVYLSEIQSEKRIIIKFLELEATSPNSAITLSTIEESLSRGDLKIFRELIRCGYIIRIGDKVYLDVEKLLRRHIRDRMLLSILGVALCISAYFFTWVMLGSLLHPVILSSVIALLAFWIIFVYKVENIIIDPLKRYARPHKSH